MCHWQDAKARTPANLRKAASNVQSSVKIADYGGAEL